MQAYNLMATIQADLNIDLSIVRQAIKKLIEETLKESRCIQFDVREDANQPGTFYLWESWRGKEGLVHHYNEIHTKTYFSKNYTQIIHQIELSSL